MVLRRRPGGPRPPPAGHHRPRPSARAQPMASADGQLVISFNGEIYNYRELQGRAAGAGPRLSHPVRHRGAAAALRRTRRGHAGQAARHVRLCAVGRAANAPCCWRATRSASSRSTTPTTARPCASPRRSRRCCGRPGGHVPGAGRPRRLLSLGQRARALDAVPRHPQSAGRALHVGRRTGRRSSPSPTALSPTSWPRPQPSPRVAAQGRRWSRSAPRCATASRRTWCPTCRSGVFLSAGLDSGDDRRAGRAHGERAATP